MGGHHSFDHTTHEGNIWLHKIADRLNLEDHKHAYSALRSTLHVLRDRLTPQSAMHLSAQLPMIIRGLFFEGWRLGVPPSDDATIESFCSHVTDRLPSDFPLDGKAVTQGVFEVIWREIDPGETAKIIRQLPLPLRGLWPVEARPGRD